MASEKNIQKMVHAIMDKRKQIGIPDWGQVPIEDVLQRLQQAPSDEPAQANSDNESKEEDT